MGLTERATASRTRGSFTVTLSKLERIFSTSSEIALEALPGVALSRVRHTSLKSAKVRAHISPHFFEEHLDSGLESNDASINLLCSIRRHIRSFLVSMNARIRVFRSVELSGLLAFSEMENSFAGAGSQES